MDLELLVVVGGVVNNHPVYVLNIRNSALPHQAGIEISDFHARVWKSDQGSRNSMQEMHGNQTKCIEFRPIKENSNF